MVYILGHCNAYRLAHFRVFPSDWLFESTKKLLFILKQQGSHFDKAATDMLDLYRVNVGHALANGSKTDIMVILYATYNERG